MLLNCARCSSIEFYCLFKTSVCNHKILDEKKTVDGKMQILYKLHFWLRCTLDLCLLVMRCCCMQNCKREYAKMRHQQSNAQCSYNNQKKTTMNGKEKNLLSIVEFVVCFVHKVKRIGIVVVSSFYRQRVVCVQSKTS